MFFRKKRNRVQEFERSFYSLGTICSIKIFQNGEMEAILDGAEAIAYEVDNQFSVFKEDSEISRINKNSGRGTTKVSGSTYFLMKKAIEYCELSDGGMDITVGPLSKMWREAIKTKCLPSPLALATGKELVDYRSIKLEEGTTSVTLEKRGMELDLGCIAKGFCADLIRDFLEKNGVEKGLINLGGNIVAIGGQPSAEPWCIGIQHPEESRGSYIGYLYLKDLSIVTSGDYERFFEKGEKKFHHIIDPRTASPLETEVVSVTILSKSSMDGDGLSTVAYMLGAIKGIELINRLNGIEVIIITKGKEIYVSNGLKDDFQQEDYDYKIRVD